MHWATRKQEFAMALLVGMGLCCEPLLGAAPNPVARVDLVQLARQAKEHFRPLPADHVVNAKTRVMQAIERLDTLLNQGPADNASRWKTYLHWDEMLALLDQANGPDLQRLSAIAMIYYHNEPGLDLPAFTELRDALVSYVQQLALAADKEMQATYATRLDQLSQWLAAYAKQPDGTLRQQIGRAVGWLEHAGQADTLVAAIRRQYQNPNLYATISERLAAAGVRAPINKQTEISDCILGTSISGTGEFQGRTNLEMVDDALGATFRLRMQGEVHSVNTGYNRGVTILSRGVTSVAACKQITLQTAGLSSAGAIAHCCTATRITGICAKSCLIEKIARKRASRSKHKAESIASRHAERRVAAQMDEEAGDLLGKASEMYQEKFRKLLVRRGQFPQQLAFQTLAHRLNVIWRQADTSQLAAPPAPPSVAGTPDLAVRLHESFVSNFSRALIGGFTLTDERVAKMLEDTTGSVPDELKIRPDKEPWSITFSSTEPVSVVFADNSIRFAIRGRRFTSGNQVIRKTLELSAVYTFKKTPTGAHLTRQGDVHVEFIGNRGRLRATQVAARAVMKRKFEALFAAEFKTEGVKLPGRWQQGGKLHLDQLSATHGWLTIAWLAPQVDQATTAAPNQVAAMK